MYHPIPEESEFWKSNRLLWAVEQVLAKKKQKDQAKLRRAWQRRLQQAIAEKVIDYPWEKFFRLRKDAREEELPEDLISAFDVTVEMVTQLWEEAAKLELAQAMVRGFDEVFARSVFEEAVRNTMPFIVGIPDTLKERLRKLLAEAMLAGEDQWDFAKRIRREWAEVSKERAEVIAWTEWARATETMTYATSVAGGLQYKVWINVGDARVCPICRANSAQGAIPIRTPFQDGNMHAPSHPRCRCTVSYLKAPELPAL